jgi:hypothetical protein
MFLKNTIILISLFVILKPNLTIAQEDYNLEVILTDSLNLKFTSNIILISEFSCQSCNKKVFDFIISNKDCDCTFLLPFSIGYLNYSQTQLLDDEKLKFYNNNILAKRDIKFNESFYLKSSNFVVDTIIQFNYFNVDIELDEVQKIIGN